MMILVGRTTAVVALAGHAGVLSVRFLMPTLVESETASVIFALSVAVVALCAFATWLLAIFHWGLRYPSLPQKVAWGAAVVFGFVFGATAYWFIATRTVIPSSPSPVEP